MRGEYCREGTEGLGRLTVDGELVRAWDEAGHWRFEGVVATGGLDRQRERLTARALGKIAQVREVELRAAHRAGAIGVVEECWIKGDEVWVRGYLDGQSAEAAVVWTRLQRGERLGLSVGGKVTEARWAWEAEVERPVRLVEAVEIEHVAVCRAEEAVNPETWMRGCPPAPAGGKQRTPPPGAGTEEAETSGPDSLPTEEELQEGPPVPAGGKQRTPPPGAETEEAEASDPDSLPTEEEFQEGPPAPAGGKQRTPPPGAGTEETVEVVVRRGLPQGLPLDSARPVKAARLWEGVL